ncbi:MAG TPA: hypothetical protein VGS61_07930, partial [Acidimicrobiales bacterium]|nr:hypothetical protein [Acidimicrobiales bacterium]
KRNGEIVTRQVEDACIFLNRPGFHRGPGCALHVLANDSGESYVGLKPDVCWQLPLHREDLTNDEGHVVTRIAQWERRDWGAGGEEFHWWCTEAPEAFTGKQRVVDSMREELVAMVGADIVDRLVAHLDERAARPASTRLSHPVIRRR